MPKFSDHSRKSMLGVHPALVQLWNDLIKVVDFTVLNGLRSEKQQELNVANGLSKTMHSKHLIQADGFGHANDVAPYPQDWNDDTDPKMSQWEVDQVYFAGIVKGFALAKGINIRTGADWNGDGRKIGQGFRDLDHFEYSAVQDLHGS